MPRNGGSQGVWSSKKSTGATKHRKGSGRGKRRQTAPGTAEAKLSAKDRRLKEATAQTRSDAKQATAKKATAKKAPRARRQDAPSKES